MRNHAPRVRRVTAVVTLLVALGSPFVSGTVGVASARTIGPAVTAAALGAPLAIAPSAPRPAEPVTALLVRVPRAMTVRAFPNANARAVGTMPSGSKYYDVPITAWVEEVSDDGRWGRVEIPYIWPRRHGWIPLRGLPRRTTAVKVHADLSERRITVTKFGRVLFSMPAAIGSAGSPTPPGEYFVTDRIAFSGGYLGTFAFGISGIQPRLPAGWSGGDQLAIHGTNAPSTIGTPASAGCLRVSGRSLDRLKPLLQLGTPVIIAP